MSTSFSPDAFLPDVAERRRLERHREQRRGALRTAAHDEGPAAWQPAEPRAQPIAQSRGRTLSARRVGVGVGVGSGIVAVTLAVCELAWGGMFYRAVTAREAAVKAVDSRKLAVYSAQA